MSADTEALNAIVSLLRRVTDLEKSEEEQNDYMLEVGDRLLRLEQPKPEKPEPVTCPECGSRHTKSRPCTAILPDRAVEHICTHCKNVWRVVIKGGYLPGQVYRIVYRTVAGAKPTFIHVRADSESRALMAFIDETSTLQISAVQLDDEYDGPLLDERLENPGGNDAKRMEGAPGQAEMTT